MGSFGLLTGEATSGMTDAMKTAISSSFQAVQSDVLDVMSSALPIALVILGAGLAITLGVKFFKKIASKS